MGAPLVLALDIGTTGNRAIVFDRALRPVSRFYEEFPQIYPKPGWVEHDAEAIWRVVRRLLDRTFRRVRASQVTAIGLTNQRETVVVWDRRTGRPVHQAIVWQDRRTAPFCEALRKKRHESSVHAKTGLVLDPYFSATKIRWILDHVPGARVRAERGDLLAGTIDSWIIWKMTGGRLHLTDSSNASRTLLFDLNKMAWDRGLCSLFGVPRRMLPEVVASSAICGLTDKAACGVELPIAGIVGDQQAASFAQGCTAPGIVKNTYGTGLFAVETTGCKPKFSKNLLTTVAWSVGRVENVEYAVEGSVFIGGAAIQWLRDGLKIIQKAADAEKLAKSLDSNDGVYFVPALSGLGAPYWDADARGTILGITRGTTAAHLARAALEAIAFQTRDILDVMQKDTRHPYKVLRVDGGASANNTLMQFQADVLGIPVERPKVLETTALGAAGLAGLAVGVWKNAREFGFLRRVDRVFRPKKDRRAVERFYRSWQAAAKRSLGWAKETR